MVRRGDISTNSCLLKSFIFVYLMRIVIFFFFFCNFIFAFQIIGEGQDCGIKLIMVPTLSEHNKCCQQMEKAKKVALSGPVYKPIEATWLLTLEMPNMYLSQCPYKKKILPPFRYCIYQIPICFPYYFTFTGSSSCSNYFCSKCRIKHF